MSVIDFLMDAYSKRVMLCLKIENVSKLFISKKSSIQALHPVDLHIEPSTRVVFLGPSGSGLAPWLYSTPEEKRDLM